MPQGVKLDRVDDQRLEVQRSRLRIASTRAARTGSWARGGNSSRLNHPMSSCSSGATFAGVPCHSRSTHALSRIASSAGRAMSRHRRDAESAITSTPSSSCSSRASAPSSDSPASIRPPGRSQTSGYARLLGLLCASRTRPSRTSAPTTTEVVVPLAHRRGRHPLRVEGCLGRRPYMPLLC